MMFNRFYNMEMMNTSASAPSANADSSCAHTARTSHTANTAMINRLKQHNPKKGLVTILTVTEKQFARMIYLTGEQDTCIGNSDARVVFLVEAHDESEL